MTVKDLIEQLEEMNPKAEVCFAFQPFNPFEHRVNDEIVQTEDTTKVFLADDGQVSYLDEEVAELLGWQ